MMYTGQPVATSRSDDRHVDSDTVASLVTNDSQDDGKPSSEMADTIDGHKLDIGNL